MGQVWERHAFVWNPNDLQQFNECLFTQISDFDLFSFLIKGLILCLLPYHPGFLCRHYTATKEYTVLFQKPLWCGFQVSVWSGDCIEQLVCARPWQLRVEDTDVSLCQAL